MRRILIAVLIALLAATQSIHAQPSELRGEELVHALQSGGYTVVLRHARTDQSIPNKETPGTVPPLRADQRNLSPAGEQDVRLMHAVVEKYALPIGEVISSPSYRCRETADAFGTAKITMTLRAYPTTAETEALVAAAPKPGTNRVLVTHHFVIEKHVPGISPGEIGESEAVVVRPNSGGKVTLIGRIKLADWNALAGVPKSEATPTAAAAPDHHVPESPVAIPATRAGRLAAAYFQAFNSGDENIMRAFTDASLVAIPDRPTDARVQAYVRLFADFGPMTVSEIQSATDDKIALLAQSKRGKVIVTVSASPDQVNRAQSVTFSTTEGHGH